MSAVAGRGTRHVAAIAILAALAVGYVAWEGARAARDARASVAEGLEARRVDALVVARVVERDGGPAPEVLQSALAAAGAQAAAGIYSEGKLETSAAPGTAASLVERLPSENPPTPAADRPSVTERGGVTLTSARLADGRVLVLAHRGVGGAGWLETLVGYAVLTLLVLGAGLGLVAWRMRRALRPTVEAATAGPPGGEAQREAEFVVETFQSVIGELQHKGRELEQATRRERERAERSERFSERVIAQMPTGVIVVGTTGRVTAANSSAREIFSGLQSESAVEYGSAFAGAPELVEMVRACLDEGVASHRREVEMDDPALGRRWLGASVSAIASESGRADAALCLVTDLTEVVALRESLRVRENLASLGEMAAGLAHELKNSLATIQGYGQLLARLVPADAEVPSAALVEEVRQLTGMVTDFLNFARPQNPVLMPANLREILDGALARASDALGRARVDLSVICPDSLTVLADESLLGRAILNLLQNAAEALEDAPGPRRMEIVATASGSECILEVRDTGPGIPVDDLPKLFIPFFTTKTRGHGIGLALTYKIISAHGGFVTAENANPGARFRCILPTM